MVHADASSFSENQTKEQVYTQILAQTRALIEGQRNWVCNLANTASLLWHGLHSLPFPSNRVNWTGFYVLDPTSTKSKPSLILGPFHGQVACQTISLGRGVCGVAALKAETQLVPDVDRFPGHIACDGGTRSEVVVPILSQGRVVGVIDLDCLELEGFDEVDVRWLEELARVLGNGCDW